MAATVGSGVRTLEHETFVYDDTEHFLRTAVPLVHAGLEKDDTVFIAADRSDALREALGADAARVEIHATDRWAPHPATRLRAFHALIEERLAQGTTGFSLMGEPLWPETPSEFRREWARYESSLNAALAAYPVTLVCLYDGGRLDPEIIADSLRTHPQKRGLHGDGPSARFLPPEQLLSEWTEVPPDPPTHAVRMADPSDLRLAREWVEAQGIAARLNPGRAQNMAIAVNEVLTNSRRHADGPTSLVCWPEDGYFHIQICDRGDQAPDPLAGYLPPAPLSLGGRGLWLTRQLVELVEIVPLGDGTLVKLWERIPD